jgi:hypothetical protein
MITHSEVPVLLIVFNRPENTRKVIGADLVCSLFLPMARVPII